jgi:hypothetical protein
LPIKVNSALSCLNLTQVNLATSSIRPGQPAAWQSALQDTLQEAVAASKASITVLTGTWQHDVDQAQLLAHFPHVQIKVCLSGVPLAVQTQVLAASSWCDSLFLP